MVRARHARGRQRDAASHLQHQLRHVLLEEHFPAASLPTQIVREIDIAYNVGLFKADAMPVFVVAHSSLLARTDTANSVGSSRKRTIELAIRTPGAPRETQLCSSREQPSRTSGAFSRACAFFSD